MGDGVNIAARLESLAKPGAICLSEDAYRQVSGRLDMAVTDLGAMQLKNIERSIRVYSLQVGVPAQAKLATGAKLNGLDERPRVHCGAPHRQFRISGKSSPCSSM
jgi:adenylate cyclase